MTLLVRETAVFTPGAGLGASKGKDIGKYAEGFSSYVHMVQDSVSTPPFSSESKLNTVRLESAMAIEWSLSTSVFPIL